MRQERGQVAQQNNVAVEIAKKRVTRYCGDTTKRVAQHGRSEFARRNLRNPVQAELEGGLTRANLIAHQNDLCMGG